MANIAAYGAYIPFHRLSRDIVAKNWDLPSVPGEKAVASQDEDSITMAVEAGLDCLSGFDSKTVDALYFASTTSPYLEKGAAPIIACALDLREDIFTTDTGGSLRCGTSALLQAMNAIDAGCIKSALVVVADTRPPEPEGFYEFSFGDGAVAFLLNKKDGIASLTEFCSISNEIAGSWRQTKDTYVRQFDARHEMEKGFINSIKEAIGLLCKKAQFDIKSASKVCTNPIDPRMAMVLAKSFGLDPMGQIQNFLPMMTANTGAPYALMLGVGALEVARPGDQILLANYGDGADALLFEVNDGISRAKEGRRGVSGYLEPKKMIETYGWYLKHKELLQRDRFTPKSSPSIYYRDKLAILNFYGVKCNACGAVQYPINRACIECSAKDQMELVKLAKKGKIFTFTLDHLVGGGYLQTPVPRAVVDLDGGGRAFFEITDAAPREIKINMEVELSFRLMHQGAGFRNYYWKARAAR